MSPFRPRLVWKYELDDDGTQIGPIWIDTFGHDPVKPVSTETLGWTTREQAQLIADARGCELVIDDRGENVLTAAASVDQDPDSYFAQRGYRLVVVERDLDAELPPDASSGGSTHWADLVSAMTGAVVARSYGSGRDAALAKMSALRRWIVEQEPQPQHSPQEPGEEAI